MLKKNELLARLNAVKLDNKKIGGIILACVVILYIDFSFILSLQVRGIGALTPKIARLKNDIATLHKEVAAHEKAKLARGATEQKLAPKAKRIISEEQIPSLLQNISEIANQNSIRVMEIKPSRETKGEGKLPPDAKLIPLLVTLDLSCGYHQFGAFLNGLENAEVFYALYDMEIAANPGNYLQQNVSLSLKTYVRK